MPGARHDRTDRRGNADDCHYEHHGGDGAAPSVCLLLLAGCNATLACLAVIDGALRGRGRNFQHRGQRLEGCFGALGGVPARALGSRRGEAPFLIVVILWNGSVLSFVSEMTPI